MADDVASGFAEQIHASAVWREDARGGASNGTFARCPVTPYRSSIPARSAAMKITKVEPLLLDRFLYVRVSTDAGITGLGESGTWGQLEASAASIAKYGEYLVGKDPFPIER